MRDVYLYFRKCLYFYNRLVRIFETKTLQISLSPSSKCSLLLVSGERIHLSRLSGFRAIIMGNDTLSLLSRNTESLGSRDGGAWIPGSRSHTLGATVLLARVGGDGRGLFQKRDGKLGGKLGLFHFYIPSPRRPQAQQIFVGWIIKIP